MLNLIRRLACASALLASGLAVSATPESIDGDWHGTASTPQGDLVLIVRFQSEGSGHSGTLESPHQAPGQLIPLQEPVVADGVLTFAIPAIAASFRGTWAEQAWVGTLNQQVAMPLTLKRGLPAPAAVIEGLDGTWNGTLRRNEVNLRLVLRIETGAQGTIARLDSPDMGALDLPVMEPVRDGSRLRFRVPAASVTYDAVLDDGDQRLHGTWQRLGQDDVEVSFVRITDATARTTRQRPQTPTPPFPYLTRDVHYDNPEAAGVRLAGTLSLPQGPGPFPAVVLISGSGPQDRNETVFGHQPFAVLADHLTRQGIAVLRHDDRGVAGSTGDHGAATSADFATDANASVRFLQQQPEIAADAIGLVGHSEGGMIAPLAAISNPDIAFLVLLAAPGTDTAHLAESQRRLLGLSQGISEESLARSAPYLQRINGIIAAADDPAEAYAQLDAALDQDTLDKLGIAPSQRALWLQQAARPWHHYFLRYDARQVLADVRIPVLALNGSLDHQVPADENLAAIAAALAHNPDTTTRLLDGLNHMFQTATTGAIGEYADIPETFAPAAMIHISDWINARFAASGTSVVNDPAGS